MIAGPVCCAATVPVSTKIPVPIIAPSPTEVSVTGPSTRFRRGRAFDLLVDGGDGLAGGELLETDKVPPMRSFSVKFYRRQAGSGAAAGTVWHSSMPRRSLPRGHGERSRRTRPDCRRSDV